MKKADAASERVKVKEPKATEKKDAKEPAKKDAKEPAKEETKEPAKEETKEPAKEETKEPAKTADTKATDSKTTETKAPAGDAKVATATKTADKPPSEATVALKTSVKTPDDGFRMKLGDDLVNISDLDDQTLDKLVKGDKSSDKQDEEKPLAGFFDSNEDDDEE